MNDENDNYVVLNNHVQFVDINTIIQCEDSSSSIVVEDYFNDHNTFQINDYLLFNPSEQHTLQTKKLCTHNVYKILRMNVLKHEKDYDLAKRILSDET